jgi:protein SCO1/2
MAAAFAHGLPASAAEELPRELEGVALEEKLGQKLDPRLKFRDHNGQTVSLGQYLADDKPVLLTLNYFTCGTLCGVQLNGVLEGLKELDWTPGDEFRVVTVSINHRESVEVAAQKRQSYLDNLGKGTVDWTFLVGDEAAIASLASEVGFQYRFDEATGQYAHPAAIAFIGPGGMVARYLYGFQYPAREVKFALMEAAAGRVGSPVEKLILSCFRFDHTAGRYTPTAYGVMRLGGILTIIAVGGFSFAMWRRELAGRRAGSAT